MNAPSIDIKDKLEGDSSLGLVYNTNLFIGNAPAQPKNCVTIFDTPGFPPQLTMQKGENYFYPSIQIRVRNKAYIAAWTLIDTIKELLHGTGPETINSTLYTAMICSGEPALLDWDESDNARFVVNFELQRRDP